MKKRGFTLAEVLTTLGIIGVIAAMTIPALVTNGKSNANAAKLAVCISNLENAFSTAVAQEGVDDLTKTRMWTTIEGDGVFGDSSQAVRNRFVGELGQYLSTRGTITSGGDLVKAYYGANEGFYLMTNNGGTDKTNGAHGMDLPGSGSVFPIMLKNGAVAWFRVYKDGHSNIEEGRTRDDIIASGSNFFTNTADVFIDVNGKTGPNTYGRDVFVFLVGDTGTLYPTGGSDTYFGENRWDTAGNMFSCTDGDKSANTGTAGWGCTGRVVEQDFKITY